MNGNKTLIHEYLRTLSGQPKSSEAVAKYVADERLARLIAETEDAFPCHELIPFEVLAEGELVAVRGEFRGIHLGTFAGVEPTGKPVRAEVIVIYRVSGKKIVDYWMRLDTLGLLNQLQVSYLAITA